MDGNSTYYAVRRGFRLRSCIFINYDDCKKFLKGYKNVEFATFDNLEQAARYLTSKRTIKKASKPRTPSDTTTVSTAQYAEWHYQFKCLREFRDAHGHCDVPLRPASALSDWMHRQTREYRKIRTFGRSELTLGRVQLLIDAGFNFHRKWKEASWSERLAQLRTFREEFGHTDVPTLHPRLGQFVVRQRVEYRRFKKGKTSTMTQKKKRDLDDLGFDFDKLRDKGKNTDKTWDNYFLDLLHFQDVYGHISVPPSYPQLGQWVINQRKSYDESESETGDGPKLTPDQVTKLVGIGLFGVKDEEIKCVPEEGRIDI